MSSKKFNLLILLLASILIGVTACAPPAEKKVWNIVWPLPPDEPKVKFGDILRSDVDVKEQSGFRTALFGEETEQALTKPYGVAVDGDGRVYVTDIGRVFVFDKTKHRMDFIGQEPGSGNLKLPIGIAISRDGKVYVSDTASDKIFVYNRDGKFLTAFGHEGEFANPSGIAIDEKRQRLYVVDAKKHNVRAYTLGGDLILTIGERGDSEGKFNSPTNIALNREGNIYVVDTNNFRVQVFDPEGKFMKIIGRAGDTPGSFARPKGIAFDSEENFYVVDAAFQNFQLFTREGQLLLFVGEGGTNPGQFLSPSGIFIDPDDRIYVVDQINARVQVFQYLGEKWKQRQAVTPKPVEKK